jgi:demethylmenaquinone methyltransferase/2-methoxy-6-polyprenyl-1,4-benzoquinol methylase
MPNPHQQQFFDDRAETWDTITTHKPQKIRHLLQYLELREGDRVLDVGTGTGVMVSFLAESVGANGCVTAIDYSRNMIEVARRKHPVEQFPQVSFRVMDVNDLGQSDQYDAIICFSCFPHFLDQAECIRRMTTTLKPGGRLMIAHEDSREYINSLHQNAGDAVEHDYLPPSEVVVRYFAAAGLQIQHVEDNVDFYIVCGKNSDQRSN